MPAGDVTRPGGPSGTPSPLHHPVVHPAQPVLHTPPSAPSSRPPGILVGVLGPQGGVDDRRLLVVVNVVFADTASSHIVKGV